MASLLGPQEVVQEPSSLLTLNFKWGKQTFTIDISGTATIADLRQQISTHTSIPTDLIKILNIKKTTNKRKFDNTCMISDCKIPKIIKIMGTAQENMISEEDINMHDLPEIFDDLDTTALTGNSLSSASETMSKLHESIANTPIKMSLMNNPRPGKMLLVLDLDHTILDFKGVPKEIETQQFIDFEKMKRPVSILIY